MSETAADAEKPASYCSFCGKSQHEVRKLIAGPTVFICDDCVEMCMDIVQEEARTEESGAVAPEPRAPSRRRGGIDRAQIRLQAWSALAGWGHKSADGKHRPYGWAEREDAAERLAEWALAEDLTVPEAAEVGAEETQDAAVDRVLPDGVR